MLKLFRHSSAVLRLCELKHFTNNATKFSKTHSNVVNEFYLVLSNTNRCRNYCTTQQKNESNECSTRSENSDLNMKNLIADNTDVDRKLKVITLETEVMRQDGCNVPSESFMKEHYWEELVKLPTRSARKRYLSFLFKLEKKKENNEMKKEKKRLEREEEPRNPVEAENGHLIYNLSNNNIFLRFYDSTINNFYHSKLIEAMMFGQQLVIDCGYHQNMTMRENINCAKQLTYLFSENRNHDDPFDLHFCNMEQCSDLTKVFHKHVPTMYEPAFPLNIHQKNYSDIFPKEKLIYLTPDCREEMLEYDHDAVYIIGAIVDKTKHEPLSLAKAKREGLRMLKLPLDRFLNWGAGSGKSLTLNQVISILLDVKKTADWKYALRHVPKRKVVNENFQFDRYKDTRLKSFNRDPNMMRTRPQNFNKVFERNQPNSRNKFNVKSIMNK